jgi:biotin synthase
VSGSIERQSGSWAQVVALLEACAQALSWARRHSPHRWLGETERELIERMQWAHDLGVTIGLFAFTPVAGAAWAERQPPPLDSYRGRRPLAG